MTSPVLSSLAAGRFWLMPADQPKPASNPALNQPDAYSENGLLVYTAAYHLKRGSCCGSGCRHCRYHPKHVVGTTEINYRTADSG
jgi:hypothetical protein